MAIREIHIEQPLYERKERWWIAGLMAIFSATLLWKLRNIQQIGDSLAIANDVRAGYDLFNPHHLLFGPSVHLVYRLLNVISWHIDAISAAQVHNICWSVIGIVCFFFILLRYSNRWMFAILSALCLLFAHTYWQFSTQSEVYVAALGPILVILAWIFLYPEKLLRPTTFIGMLLLLFLSICYNQSGVWLLAPLWVYYYQTQGRKGLQFMLLFTIASGVLTLGAYVAVYMHVAKGQSSMDGFIHYCLQYAYLNPDWGTARHFTDWNEWSKIFFNQSIAFLPIYHISKVPMSVLVAGYIILWGWNIRMARKKGIHYTFRVFPLVWLLVLYLFLVWWTAGYEFFVLSLLPTLLLVLFMAYDLSVLAYRRWSTELPLREPVYYFVPVALILVIFARYNMPSFIHYHRDHDSGYLEAERANELCGPCKIITNFNIQVNLRYYQRNPNAEESDGLYIAYYYRDTVSSKYQLRKDTCVLTELWYLNPWYNSLGQTGYDVPAKWWNMADNFFDIRRQNDSIDCRRFTIYPAIGSTGNYIKAGPERIRYPNLQQFFYALNDSISAKGITKEAVYKDWYGKNGNMIGK